MLSSTLFHTFSCHSEEAHDSWQETDHLGILCALFGTYISLLSIVFSCFPVSLVLLICEKFKGKFREKFW
jgi:predicted membrane channel-forming protein YqfA (hemolysin III family)